MKIVQVEILSAANPEEGGTQVNERIQYENPDIIETKFVESAKSYTLWVFYRI
ncbi:hypothetical protein [Lactobacillus taiwanensis]|uniref:hypothetical protein n=1 Tax=Lactobacillus taiwanensis TaxID=508451 RepID=UPI00164A6461|nr:hypothetical protein [Lactobacillus taiwanensis]